MALHSNSNALLEPVLRLGRGALLERLLTKPIHSGEVLFESGAPIIHFIFPHGGIISLQAILNDGRTVERTSIGREDAVGITEYALGQRFAPCRAVVAVSGRASWLPVDDLNPMLSDCSEMRELVQKCHTRLISSLIQSVACASVHSASQRLATWLLCAGDRADTQQLDLTQRTLADIFGLRLATISDACSRLHAAGAINQGRGHLTIINRELLRKQACECYDRWTEIRGL